MAMRLTSTADTTSRSSAKSASLPVRAIEKTSSASALNHQTPHTDQTEQKPLPRIQVELVSQGGTESFDPNWDGPRLLPTFVAQVIGQVMNETIPERRMSAPLETAYGTARLSRMALLLDRKS
jgi:hypothetical protein